MATMRVAILRLMGHNSCDALIGVKVLAGVNFACRDNGHTGELRDEILHQILHVSVHSIGA